MILFLSTSTFTTLHVILSLVGIAAGVISAVAMLRGKVPAGWTAVFLATTVLTSLTGFLFPFSWVTPAIVFGVVSLVVLALALLALYGFRLRGAWRVVYTTTALFALYLNAFVAVVQAFQKLAFLQPLAPTQSEPPFFITQAAVLALFLLIGLGATVRFRPAPAST